MNADIGDLTPDNIDPDRLLAILEEIGWTSVGGRSGSYRRLVPPGAESNWHGSLLVPLNAMAPDFAMLMRAALRLLSEDRNLWAHDILPKLSVEPSDEFKFRKETSAPRGLIAWREGETLVVSARRAFLAGAKAYVSPNRHYSNSYGQFANRYLENVLMGQTAPGSYVVTAFAPAEVLVPLQGGSQASNGQAEPRSVPSRAVSQAVVRAIEATAEALDHYRHRGSLAGFDEGVQRGVSYEMVMALFGIISNSDGAEISVEWDSSVPLVGGSSSIALGFRGSDARVLETAANNLIDDGDAQRITVTGRVHLLAKKEARSPGVFGVDGFGAAQPKKVRVRLRSDDEYSEAVRAHEEDLAVRVSGNLQREGNLFWLYNAVLVETLGPVEDFDDRSRRRSQRVRGQIPLFAEGTGEAGTADTNR